MWPNLQETADLVGFTEEILNGKLPLLCRTSLWKGITAERILPKKFQFVDDGNVTP